jgi:3-deoxy-D-manno-octulosonic-acid transferase
MEGRSSRRTLWMHVSSLGEFEQGRPVLERWKEQFPNDRILLSFYSPSGYNIRKNYPLADLVFYLPVDTRGRMIRLVNQLKPDLFILVKYDFWPNLLQVLHGRKVPCYLISACFRPDQYLFKPWGQFFLRQLKAFEGIFVQEEDSCTLLKENGFERVMVAGDTRVDAVMKRELKSVRHRVGVIMGGSTWPAEERMLAKIWSSEDFRELGEKWRLVLAPHDISEEHLVLIEELFNGDCVRHSRIDVPFDEALIRYRVIIIDSIGLLSSLYAYAHLAIIGGGFGKGIHNILEPAAYGIPVVFGPKWTKFREAGSLIDIGAAFPVKDLSSFSTVVKKLCSDSIFRTESGNLAVSYMKSQMGSSDLIIRYLLGKW